MGLVLQGVITGSHSGSFLFVGVAKEGRLRAGVLGIIWLLRRAVSALSG